MRKARIVFSLLSYVAFLVLTIGASREFVRKVLAAAQAGDWSGIGGAQADFDLAVVLAPVWALALYGLLRLTAMTVLLVRDKAMRVPRSPQ